MAETALLSISRKGELRLHIAKPTPAESPVRFPLIDGSYRINGRAEPVVIYAPDARTVPIENLYADAAPAGAA